ncbi:PIN domain-containing protein [Amphiplicatus metriothermophilus]|uniref:Ribonuclease VapC n=1 Tax=Amphiplicatus metriothermophilus TaxID=1519374 RepID=A0A239PWZ2_9PROT|nr:PIN domain-containing protein [Amphiplicatus metriothermophilus]MBB5519938.1 putative nucleic acid-binding protein [Amphiplicatus metriothermophilus]SNT74839.1 Predicted nucleic acid-binding protein, contains PIN domain [Amphiplicatus metriothermophilus]
MPVFLDTNVLVYSISLTPGDRKKRARAETLLRRADCVLSVQVLQEFYVQATRATKASRLTHDEACALIAVWRRFQVVENSLALLEAALAIKSARGFSLWDCLVLAAARHAKCKTLYTEDLSHGQVVDGVEIVNPFREP